jgi:hypothetical protein
LIIFTFQVNPERGKEACSLDYRRLSWASFLGAQQEVFAEDKARRCTVKRKRVCEKDKRLVAVTVPGGKVESWSKAFAWKKLTTCPVF